MSKYTGSTGVVANVPPVADDATPQHELGTRIETPDGRVYRYIGAGGTALIPGNVVCAEAEDTGEQDVAFAAQAAGSFSVTTTTTLTVTANEYAGGYLVVTVTPGIGECLRIKSHPAATAATVVFTLEDPIQTAFTTDTRADFIPNPYDNVVITTVTTFTGAVLGVAANNITANQYGWIQTRGIASVLQQGTVAVNAALSVSNGTAGALEAAVTAQPVMGIAMAAITDGQNGAVFLMCE